VGLAVGLLGSIRWLLVIIAFTLLGFLATLSNISEKKERGLQEGRHGERRARNVLGVGVPCIFAALFGLIPGVDPTMASVAFISAVSVAAADTVASEIGVKSENVRLITNMKKVPVGTDGGVSLYGTGVALLGAVVSTAIGWVVIFGISYDALVFVPIVAGLAGCMMDSVLGATVESRGFISKYANNALTGVFGALLAATIVHLLF